LQSGATVAFWELAVIVNQIAASSTSGGFTGQA
jgi:hypothetical protein